MSVDYKAKVGYGWIIDAETANEYMDNGIEDKYSYKINITPIDSYYEDSKYFIGISVDGTEDYTTLSLSLDEEEEIAITNFIMDNNMPNPEYHLLLIIS